MFIKKISMLYALCSMLFLFGCAEQGSWHSEYGTAPAGQPSQIQSSLYYPEYNAYGGNYGGASSYAPIAGSRNVSVLLPMSGPNAALGRGIATSVSMAFLQHRSDNITVTFHDLSGNKIQRQTVIANALASGPDVIIGPIFAEDAAMLRDAKPSDLPALSFSSDMNAVGGGVMTMALMPTQSVEEIVRQIRKDGAKGFVILAPNTGSGQLMAAAAVQSANLYDLPISGLFYYDEGGSESIKSAAQRASMFSARSAANNKAREILSEILRKEALGPDQKISLNAQLDKLSKSDTLGGVPFDAILFLGGANDSKSLASYLRYFDVGARDVAFYGTALWDTPELLNDFTMTGARFAALAPMSPDFSKLFEATAGNPPSRLDTFGFDAANLAIGMLHSTKQPAAYLLDPSGFKGLDGLFRLRPSGISERALQVMELNGTGGARLVRAGAADFLTPAYNVQPREMSRPAEIALVSPGINPMDYIQIPDNLRGKYQSKTFGANMAPIQSQPPADAGQVVILPEDDSDILSSPEFQPIPLEPIDRRLIDNVEMN